MAPSFPSRPLAPSFPGGPAGPANKRSGIQKRATWKLQWQHAHRHRHSLLRAQTPACRTPQSPGRERARRSTWRPVSAVLAGISSPAPRPGESFGPRRAHRPCARHDIKGSPRELRCALGAVAEGHPPGNECRAGVLNLSFALESRAPAKNQSM